MLKTCSTCRQTLDITEYHKHKSNKDGLSGICKSCIRIKNRSNKEKRNSNYKRFLAKNPHYRSNHKINNIDHIKPFASFDLNDTKQLKKVCHYINLQPLWWLPNLIKGAKYGQ